jgi:hypothetical protein
MIEKKNLLSIFLHINRGEQQASPQETFFIVQASLGIVQLHAPLRIFLALGDAIMGGVML